MGTKTKIEWTHHTFSPWRGCTKVSPGCQFCYAETLSHRNPKVLGEWGPKGVRAIASESYWRQPLKWGREAAAAGERRRVFCASLADVFEDRPELEGPRDRLFHLIEITPHLNWLLLTKRPENFERMLWPQWLDNPRETIWLGVSVEDQQRADERIPVLLDTPAAVRFLSCEPLLGPVDLHQFVGRFCGCGIPGDACDDWKAGRCRNEPTRIDWVIVGGESGPGARPCDVAWVRSIVAQCRAAGTACFVKQLGAEPFDSACDPVLGPLDLCLIRQSKGGDPAEWPADLRVREFPR